MSGARFRRKAAPFLILSLIGVLAARTALAIEGDTVVLQGLDKVTARVWTFEARIGEPGLQFQRPSECIRGAGDVVQTMQG